MAPLDSEKTNLEMHVELQALRDKAVHEELAELSKKISDVVASVRELKQSVDSIKEHHSNQLISWGSAIIVTLISALGVLFLKVIGPLLSKVGN